jgi:predicted nucleotidyltransferase
MGTEADNPLGAALFSKNRRAILGLLYAHTDQQFYLRQVVRASGGGIGAVQRELGRLAKAGILRRTVRDKQVYFQADPDCPIFPELRGLVTKTVGVADVLRAALAPLAERIAVAFVHGSVARAREHRGSDVDLMVIGNVGFADAVSLLADAQEILRREVNPTVYPPDEYRAQLGAGNQFLARVLQQPKIFLIGSEHELTRLAAERLARRTADESPGNRGPVERDRP